MHWKQDELCCARAIVTMKARVHKGDDVNEKQVFQALSIGKPRMIVFKGPSASKKILKVLYEHFQGGTSLGVFFNRSYHC